MHIGFVGDVHGRIFLALAALATWQRQTGQQLDVIIQVGDMGAYPDLANQPPGDNAYLAADPTEADFSRLLHATGQRAEALRQLRAYFATPLLFIRGNHEDIDWLNRLPRDPAAGSVSVDSFGLLRYVPDGTILRWNTLLVAFLGGEEAGRSPSETINLSAYETISRCGVGTIDVLVTHDAPYGVSVGYYGQTQGSQLISALVEQVQPKVHVAGHYGFTGVRHHGSTTFLDLNHLVASVRWHPDAQGIQEGSLAVLDTQTMQLVPVIEPWLAAFATPFDFDTWWQSFL